jgi:hypothetical protein
MCKSQSECEIPLEVLDLSHRLRVDRGLARHARAPVTPVTVRVIPRTWVLRRSQIFSSDGSAQNPLLEYFFGVR